MKIYFAPLEGITDSIFRNSFEKYYSGIDKYFTPFLSPNSTKKFTTKEWNNINPDMNNIENTVPQLLTNNSEHFLWAAREIADIGYEEINFNLGCPSGTVVAKKKGSGLLFYPELLYKVLYEIFDGIEGFAAKRPSISIKTRLGKNNPDEFYEIMDIFNKYPIFELTIHPRIQTDFYKGSIRYEYFNYAFTHSKNPLVYNGDLNSVSEINSCFDKYGNIQAVMLGRGLLVNPELASSFHDKSYQPFNYERFWQFHDELLSSYEDVLSGEAPLLHRLKEFWTYWQVNFTGQEKIIKKIRKSNRIGEYKAAIEILRQAQSAH